MQLSHSIHYKLCLNNFYQINKPFHFLLDILCGVEKIQEELHPSFHRNKLVLPVQSMEQDEKSLHLPFHESVLRLLCHGDYFAQLRLPGHG